MSTLEATELYDRLQVTFMKNEAKSRVAYGDINRKYAEDSGALLCLQIYVHSEDDIRRNISRATAIDHTSEEDANLYFENFNAEKTYQSLQEMLDKIQRGFSWHMLQQVDA